MPEEAASLPFPVEALPLRHASLTLGYRIAVDGRMIGYCPDTGYCENAVTLARSADLLITECAYKQGQSSEEWPHLNPETAARIARGGGGETPRPHPFRRGGLSEPSRTEGVGGGRRRDLPRNDGRNGRAGNDDLNPAGRGASGSSGPSPASPPRSTPRPG